MISTYLSYRLASANMTTSLDRVAKDPAVSREVAYWNANIGKATDIASFVGDTRLFNFAMKAFGLQDMGYAKAFMTKLLKEGTSEATAMANKLADPRYKAFAKAFDFSTYGTTTTQQAAASADVASAYLRQSLEEATGQTSEGARLALYFQRAGAKLTSPMQVLADSALFKVVQTATGLPAAMSNLDIDKQASMIAAKLDVTSLSDPARMDAFLKRFTALYDVSNSNAAASSPAVMLMQGAGTGVGVDLMMSIAQLKTGG